MPQGSKLTTPRAHNFTLNYIRKSSNVVFSWTADGNFTKLNRNGLWVVPYHSSSNGSDWLHMYVKGSKIGFQNYKALSFHIWYIASSRGPLPKLFKLCPWGQNWLRPGGHNFTLNYIKKSSNDIFSWTANGKLTKLNRNDVLIGCMSRSWGQKIGSQNATFKNIFVWNYRAQSFHIWYIASSRGPLPNLFKLCPWGQNWLRPGGHNFTLNYIRNSSNDIFPWTTNGKLTKLNRNGLWVVPYQNCSNGSDWLHF